MSHLLSPHMIQKAIRKLSERGMHLPATASRQEVAQAVAMVEDRPIPQLAADMGALIRQFIDVRPNGEREKPPEYNPWPTMGEVYKRIRLDFAYKGLF